MTFHSIGIIALSIAVFVLTRWLNLVSQKLLEIVQRVRALEKEREL